MFHCFMMNFPLRAKNFHRKLSNKITTKLKAISINLENNKLTENYNQSHTNLTPHALIFYPSKGHIRT